MQMLIECLEGWIRQQCHLGDFCISMAQTTEKTATEQRAISLFSDRQTIGRQDSRPERDVAG
jgi:hypothetical protein